jgi:hypothetical protein
MILPQDAEISGGHKKVSSINHMGVGLLKKKSHIGIDARI